MAGNRDVWLGRRDDEGDRDAEAAQNEKRRWPKGFDAELARRRLRGESELAGAALREEIVRLVAELRPTAQAYLDGHPHLSLAEHDAYIRDSIVRPAVTSFNQWAGRVARDLLPESTVGEVFSRLRGLGPLGALMDNPTITEIMVNGPDVPVYVEREGRIVKAVPEITLTEDEILLALERMQAGRGQPLGEGNPTVEVRLPYARVTAVHQKLAPLGGPILTIRKRSEITLTAAELIEKGMLSPALWAFLAACLEGGSNILIAGDFGSGKTTLAQALISALPGDKRIVTVEDPIEFAVTHPHVLQLEVHHATLAGQGAISARALVRLCLRLRPTYLVVGEVRDEAAWDMVDAMSLGHAGSLSTIHGQTPRAALKRLEHLCLRAADAPPLPAVRSALAEAINLIVVARRHTEPSDRGGATRRVVSAVSEVRGLEGDVYQMQDLLVWRDGALQPTGFAPSERLVERAADRGIALPDLGGRGFDDSGDSRRERAPW
jgi:pilus assembly protein CpaF